MKMGKGTKRNKFIKKKFKKDIYKHIINEMALLNMDDEPEIGKTTFINYRPRTRERHNRPSLTPVKRSRYKTRTANGMASNESTGSHVLDFFSQVGSSRGMDASDIFIKAVGEDEELSLRALQWMRDIREGSGERQQFRTILKKLDLLRPDLTLKIMSKIPILGRFDDLFSYVDPTNRIRAFELIKKELNDGNRLCAKWMPRKGPVAAEVSKFLKISPKNYRHLVVRTTNVVETQMCRKDFENINFSQVPSIASTRYQKAFSRNATVQYGKYIEDLSKPGSGAKVNAGAVYPYEICKAVRKGANHVMDAQWEALPNWVGNASIIPIIDVSGSMDCGMSNVVPMDAAISLGLYVTEKNTSGFKGMYLTFSNDSQLKRVKGSSLQQKIDNIEAADWGGSTNLHRAFDRILQFAISKNLEQDDMPKILLILSDMEFNCCCKFDDSAQEMIRRKFDISGYEVPRIVFWNLASCTTSFPVKMDDNNVCSVSGISPSIMKSVLSDSLDKFSPRSIMLETLNSERYDLN